MNTRLSAATSSKNSFEILQELVWNIEKVLDELLPSKKNSICFWSAFCKDCRLLSPHDKEELTLDSWRKVL